MTSLKSSLRNLVSAVLDLLYPNFCGVCGSFLFREHYFVACKECWEENFTPYTGEKCSICGHPLEFLPGAPGICKRCLEKQRTFNFDAVSYFTLYRGLPEFAVKELKFSRLKPVADVIGKTISDHLLEVLSRLSVDLVVPVPVSRETLKERGFNQTEEILRGAGVPYISLLEKPFTPEKQSTLSFKERSKNVRGVFRIRKEFKMELFGKSVLVFDDVFTTGATANEIAGLLKRYGARKVHVYTVCYTPFLGSARV